MLPAHSILILVLAVLFSNSVSTVTGFGTSVLALPFCTMVLGVHTAVPLVALISMSSAIYMTLREHRQVQWLMLGAILAWGAIGFLFGNLGYHFLPMRYLKLGAGMFVICLAVHTAWRLYHAKSRRPWNPVAGRCLLVVAGLLQGALAVGGSLFAAYAHRALHRKGESRATLFALWIVFNATFLVSYFGGRDHSAKVLLLGLWCAPGAAAGIWLGQRIHHWASERVFQGIVAATLFAAGVSLILK